MLIKGVWCMSILENACIRIPNGGNLIIFAFTQSVNSLWQTRAINLTSTMNQDAMINHKVKFHIWYLQQNINYIARILYMLRLSVVVLIPLPFHVSSEYVTIMTGVISRAIWATIDIHVRASWLFVHSTKSRISSVNEEPVVMIHQKHCQPYLLQEPTYPIEDDTRNASAEYKEYLL